tara:strand:- start:2450 stop:2893 length:444 start_codon:yes stop_codon:yes gene_type:complete
MIEVRTADEPKTETGQTPEKITTSMILNDLENGIDRNGIKEKYNLQAWEVKQMFEHPTLKGKKAKKKRKLSFEFVDDTENAVNPNQTTIPMPDGSEIDELDAAEPAVEASLNDELREHKMNHLRESFDELDEEEDADDSRDVNEFEY